MSTSFETHDSRMKVRVAEAETPGEPLWPAAQDRMLCSVLPAGWTLIGRCRFGTGGPGRYATGCHALAHPDIGVALLDVVPNATPNAEARLRRALTAAEFWPDFPGTLPVVHDRLDGAGMRRLPLMLERGFAALPALTVPGGTAWIEGVQQAMEADPAWELQGKPKPMPDAPLPPTEDFDAGRARPTTQRRWGRLTVLPLAFAGTFALGLVSGFVLLDSPTPTPQQPVLAALPQPSAAAAPTPAQTVVPPEAPVATRVVEAPVMPATPAVSPGAAPQAVAAAAEDVQPVASPPPDPVVKVAAAPVEAPAAPRPAGPTEAGSLSAVSPMETQLSQTVPAGDVLPMAPPRAPSPPVRVSASQSPRATPVIDRTCSQALFRFQQGERLTAAEQNFVRTGCSTSRR